MKHAPSHLAVVAVCLLPVLVAGCGRESAVPRSAPVVEAVEPATVEPTEFVALRKEWQPRAKRREWKYLVLHHTATDRGSVESIHEAHLKRRDGAGRPWLGIGYHFVVGNGRGMKDGQVEPTFRWREQLHGAHAGSREYNNHGIGIVLVGNFENGPPTAAQTKSLRTLLATLSDEFDIGPKQIVPHRDLKATACPGKYFPLHDVALATTRDSETRGEWQFAEADRLRTEDE